jgi:DUF1365 family protein
MPSDRHGASVTGNGPLPLAAACLYRGEVMHQRMKPFGHRFRYRVFSLLVDLDRLAEADRLSPLFSVNRRNLLSFFEKDHSGEPETTLRAYVDHLLVRAGVEPAARVVLVCYPRVFGYVFNPLSIYYAYGRDGALAALVYEVRNTFGERHTYVCPLAPGELSESGVRQSCDKRFHVSPFIPMDMRYHFRMLPPGKEIRWRILETDEEGPLLAATFSGRQMGLTTATITHLSFDIPLVTIKIVAGIHWEALKLWIKGARYIARPKAPPPVSVQRAEAIAEAAE